MTSDELKFLRVGDVIDSPIGPGIVMKYFAEYYSTQHPESHLYGPNGPNNCSSGTQIHASVIVRFFSNEVSYAFNWWLGPNGAVIFPLDLEKLNRRPELSDFSIEMHRCSVYYKAQ